jgi:hypothetical protein
MEEARRIEAQLRPGISPGRTVCSSFSSQAGANDVDI